MYAVHTLAQNAVADACFAKYAGFPACAAHAGTGTLVYSPDSRNSAFRAVFPIRQTRYASPAAGILAVHAAIRSTRRTPMYAVYTLAQNAVADACA
jgi:hypothetical protein